MLNPKFSSLIRRVWIRLTVVRIQIIEIESRRIAGRGSCQSLCSNKLCRGCGEVDGFAEPSDEIIHRDVNTITGKEPVVCQRIQHRTGASA